jgi:DNA-directed RNA polymerase specialized sigma24 family protein
VIAIAKRPRDDSDDATENRLFLSMLPHIKRYALFAFRDLKGEARDEAVQEVIASSFVAFARLCERGKADLAYPSVLARFAVAQLRSGRRVGNRLNCRDVLSEYAQRSKGFSVERLDKFDHYCQLWQEVLVEDRRASPADLAMYRIDFRAWLQSLPVRRRRIAQMLAAGFTTQEAAKQFGVSPGRISQLRRLLKHNWEDFHSQGKLQEATA